MNARPDDGVVFAGDLNALIDRVARSDAGVLLRGESGVGKDMVAREIHRRSSRQSQPFIKVNCVALPTHLLESELFGHERGAFTGAAATRPGKFESADHGTILLDEIADMPAVLQPKLLQVLQDHQVTRLGSNRPIGVDVRVIAATNRDIDRMMRAGTFRADVYYRLQIVEIRIPPLRDRRDEIPALARFFMDRYAGEYRRPAPAPSAALVDALVAHAWPGNIRELENLMKRFVVLQDEAQILTELQRLRSAPAPAVAAKPVSGAPAGTNGTHGTNGANGQHRSSDRLTNVDLTSLSRTAALSAERSAIEQALDRFHWNRRKAAKYLNVSYKTLLNKMKECGISAMVVLALASLTTACAATAQLAVEDGMGARPVLPMPSKSFIPEVNVVTAIGWPEHATPVAGEGLDVAAFARGLDHPRWIYVLPNGDVLVAETNAPPRPEDAGGFKGWFFKRYQKKAGGAVQSANRITLLRDANGDGIAETRFAFLTGLNSPFGMALVGDTLYVANTDAVVRFPYKTGDTTITAAATKVADLPAGPRNHHWTKSLIASADGSRLYVGVGSNSNVAEHGMDEEEGRAAIWEFDTTTGKGRIFASGLRNPVGMAWESGALWTAVNERDELGSDLVPDYMTIVEDGAFYGWPYSYFGQIVDDRVKPKRPELVARARKPDYALGPHTASLGLCSSRGTSLPIQYREGMFVGQHGSWNRKPRSGYKVIFVPFAKGKPVDLPLDVLTGFVTEDGDALGRPVGVALDRRGALLVADDVGNVIWRVAAVTTESSR